MRVVRVCSDRTVPCFQFAEMCSYRWKYIGFDIGRRTHHRLQRLRQPRHCERDPHILMTGETVSIPVLFSSR